MIVATVRLTNFRNHSETACEFGEGINALLGGNGQGKTNVLEAISYLSLTKSFYASSDGTVLQIGRDHFEVAGTIVSGAGIENHVRIRYLRDPGEKLFEINGTRPERFSSVIGRFPVVILSPENSAITFGAPADRRKFIDLVLSQVSPSYLETLLEYRRVLRQRNRILSDARHRQTGVRGLIEPWDASLAHHGGILTFRRRRFLEDFRGFVTRSYEDVAGSGETPGIVYLPSCETPPESNEDEIMQLCLQQIEERRAEETRRGVSLVGPHRDDIGLTIDDIPVQQYASQGQHKTLLVALKVAEFHFLLEQRNEHPIFLLDDLFSELDSRRSTRILRLVGGLGQTVITTTDGRAFHESVLWNGRNRRFFIEHGTCRQNPEKPVA